MAVADDILSQIPLSQLAAQLGTDEATAEAAVRQVVPGLVGGMQANAADAGGAGSLASALEQHADSPLFNTSGAVDLDAVDIPEGEKIVGHVFGGNTDAVTQRLAGSTGVGGDLIKRLLPILAPIVLGYLAKRVFGGGSPGAGQTAPQSGGGLMDILGSVLGGSAGGAMGGALGGLFGGSPQPDAPAQQPASTPPSGGVFNSPEQRSTPTFDLPVDATEPEPHQNQPQSGGGIMDILGDLLGQGRRS